MRQTSLIVLCLTGAVTLAACEKSGDKTVERAFQDVNVVDETDLNHVMLTVADPNEAVTYFQRATTQSPDRIDLQRGLATSLVRAKRHTQAAAAWGQIVDMTGATAEDQVNYADALIRAGDWDKARSVLNSVPPTHETFKRYRLEAMVADANQDWKRADSFYETAVGLTTRPSGVMNNWGYSKLSRGSYGEAERLFGEAIRQDPTLFTAKNNLVLARGAQRNYNMPVVPMSQTEHAQLLHTMALSAVKQGDIETGKGLLREAINTHPQHFDEAVRSLRALEAG